MNTPFTKDELEAKIKEIEIFIQACLDKDSYGRAQVWSFLVGSCYTVLREEQLHNFQFPSPHNPNKFD